MDDIPTCVTFADLIKRTSQRVRVIGVYINDWTRIDSSVYPDHVCIALPDRRNGPMVNLPGRPEASRAAEEIARLQGKHVVVVGKFYANAPPATPQPSYAATFSPPCVVVESLRLAEPDEVPKLGPMKPYEEPMIFDD